mgnify:FL=1
MKLNDFAFIDFVKQECKRVGIKCILKNVKSVKLSEGSNARCSGYFDSENKELVVSMKRPDSLAILVHEYCHLTQWEEQIPLWKKADVSLTKIDEWLCGKEIRNIKKHLAIARDLELDNEKRSVKMIRKWKLSINIKDYIQKANSYIHFYNYIYYTRKWSKPRNTPYTNKQIQAIMSDRFNMRYDVLPEKIHNAFVAAKI